MFVSINHITVTEGREEEFEALWRNRDRGVEEQPGFISLDVLRPGMILAMSSDPPRKQDNTYHVMTRWESSDAFMGWVKSDAFRRAHQQSRDPGLFAGKAVVTTHEIIEGAGATCPANAADTK